jgi:hypothetical protein
MDLRTLLETGQGIAISRQPVPEKLKNHRNRRKTLLQIAGSDATISH